MKFELEVGDRLRTVEIQRRPEGFEVAVDGRVRCVDVSQVGPSTWSLLVRDAADGVNRSVEASIVPHTGSSGFDVHIAGFSIPVQLKGGLGRRSRDLAAGGRASGPQRVVAPMPGKVVRVLVARGDEVKARQGLVVVEAMKMENELRAARDGRIGEVFVAEGQSVEAGTPLVVVE